MTNWPLGGRLKARTISRYLVCVNGGTPTNMEDTEGISLEEDETFSYGALSWMAETQLRLP